MTVFRDKLVVLIAERRDKDKNKYYYINFNTYELEEQYRFRPSEHNSFEHAGRHLTGAGGGDGLGEETDIEVVDDVTTVTVVVINTGEQLEALKAIEEVGDGISEVDGLISVKKATKITIYNLAIYNYRSINLVHANWNAKVNGIGTLLLPSQIPGVWTYSM